MVSFVTAKRRFEDVQPRPVELWLRELPLSPKGSAKTLDLAV
jgi:hypothetical protein